MVLLCFSLQGLMAFFNEVCTSEMLLKEVSLAVTEPGGFCFLNSRVSSCGLWSTSWNLAPVCVFKMLYRSVQEVHLRPGPLCFPTAAPFGGARSTQMSLLADGVAALKADNGQEVGPCSRTTLSHPNAGDFHILGCLLQKEYRLGSTWRHAGRRGDVSKF